MPLLLATLLGVAAAVAAGALAVNSNPHWVLIASLGLIFGFLAFFSPKLSVILLVFSMLLSPEMGAGAVGGGRSVVLRYDDILLIIIFFGWFAKTAIFKDKAFITGTPVHGPMLLYSLICVLSTGLGAMRGDIEPVRASFYVLKYVQYFMLYFMTVNVIDTEEEARRYLKFGLFVAFIVTVYAYWYYSVSGPMARATAPFEAPVGGDPRESEPASLGGYYMLVFGVLAGLMTEYSGRTLLWAGAALAFMFPAFLLTFSRASYIGLAVMAAAFLMLTRRRRAIALFLVLSSAAAALTIPGLSEKVQERVTMTYRGPSASTTVDLGSAGRLRLEESAALRIFSLKNVVFNRLPKRPALGWGVTGIGMGDTQYALLLGEVGLLGTAVFFFLIWRVFASVRRLYREHEEPWVRGAAVGLASALVGLLAQASGVNTFIIVRIMEPFWFLTAVLMKLQSLRASAPPREPSA